jgi:hypothetical protein
MVTTRNRWSVGVSRWSKLTRALELSLIIDSQVDEGACLYAALSSLGGIH